MFAVVTGVQTCALPISDALIADAIVRFLVGADVDSQDATPLRLGDAGQRGVDPAVVEPHPVDDRTVFGEAEQAGAGVARLRQRGERADLDRAETEPEQPVDRAAVLVEPGGEADRVGEATIGRASGRERVCRYVAQSGGGG